MTFVNIHLVKPKKIYLKNNESNLELLVHGQGVFLFRCNYLENCKIKLLNNSGDGFIIYLNPLNIYAINIINQELLIDNNNNQGLINKEGVYYWISLDSQNQRLIVGIGEARIDNIIYKYEWKFTKEEEEERKANKKFLESIKIIKVGKKVKPICILRDPITKSVPMFIKNTNELTIENIGEGKYLPHSNLNSIGKKLYECISGCKFILDDEDFPDFSKAIENSIKTPGLWCFEKLKEKSTEFNKDKPNLYETYLRITLGENNGESPGIPYVIEIWPPQHYSPIHNHGGANAVIRVLHGSINVSLYPYLSDGVEPFGKVDFNKDDVTWINPTLNQVHQLRNIDENTTCITIQCYMYDEEDRGHYDYFDYLNNKGISEQYEPDSDMDFIEFKKLIKEEWETINNNTINYNEMTINKLKEICKERNIKIKSRLNKEKIIDLLNK